MTENPDSRVFWAALCNLDPGWAAQIGGEIDKTARGHGLRTSHRRLVAIKEFNSY